jgi:hypothetical protein
VRHINWHLSKPTSERDTSIYTQRIGSSSSCRLFWWFSKPWTDLFVHFLGKISQANGISVNQQGLYSAKDAIVGCWTWKWSDRNRSWNFGTNTREDFVTIYGSLGTITFSVFEETNKLNEGDLVTDLFIPHPENVQFYHVQNIRDHLAGKTHLPMVLRQVIPLSYG